MEINKIIRQRRSLRHYKKDMPEDEEVEKILDAGRWAPSGLNNQPWRFLVVKDTKEKDGLAEFTKYGGIIKSAPIAIVVCMDIAASYGRDKDLMAIGACIQNMLLQAHALGLGTCWLGEILNKKEEVRQYFKLDKNLELMAVVVLGSPDESDATGSRKPLREMLIK